MWRRVAVYTVYSTRLTIQYIKDNKYADDVELVSTSAKDFEAMIDFHVNSQALWASASKVIEREISQGQVGISKRVPSLALSLQSWRQEASVEPSEE